MAENEPPVADDAAVQDAAQATPEPTTSRRRLRRKPDPEEQKRAQQAADRQRRNEQARRRRALQAQQAALEAASDDWLIGASSRAYTLIAGAFALALGCVAVVVATMGDTMNLSHGARILLGLGFALAGFLSFVVAISIPPIRRARKELRKREALARERARQAMEEISDATDLSALLVANRKQMDAYDDLARLQAKESFRNSQAAIALGLFALLVGGLVALLASDTTSKITTATLTGLAAALSGYIGRTFLRVYERAQQQLTFFFQQPLVNSYILGAERLIQDMENEHKDKEVSRIVSHVMEVLIQLPATWQEWTHDDGRKRRRLRRAPPSPNGDATGTSAEVE